MLITTSDNEALCQPALYEWCIQTSMKYLLGEAAGDFVMIGNRCRHAESAGDTLAFPHSSGPRPT